MIELDCMLDGLATQEEYREFFKDGEFYDEPYLIDCIKLYLLTADERQGLFDRGLSISDCLNGRYTGDHAEFVTKMYNNWNEKLGYIHFGS